MVKSKWLGTVTSTWMIKIESYGFNIADFAPNIGFMSFKCGSKSAAITNNRESTMTRSPRQSSTSVRLQTDWQWSSFLHYRPLTSQTKLENTRNGENQIKTRSVTCTKQTNKRKIVICDREKSLRLKYDATVSRCYSSIQYPVQWSGWNWVSDLQQCSEEKRNSKKKAVEVACDPDLGTAISHLSLSSTPLTGYHS